MDEFRNGWGILLASIIGTATGLLAITIYTQGLFVQHVISEFGWSRGEFFNGFTLLKISGLITVPLTGPLIDKIGAKKIGIIGICGHSLCYVLLSLNKWKPMSLVLPLVVDGYSCCWFSSNYLD